MPTSGSQRLGPPVQLTAEQAQALAAGEDVRPTQQQRSQLDLPQLPDGAPIRLTAEQAQALAAGEDIRATEEQQELLKPGR